MRILAGLIVLVALALLASHRRWWSIQRYPVIAVLMSGGWVAVGIGIILGPYVIGLIEVEQVKEIKPLIVFCLGWIGFMVGLQAHYKLPKLLPRGAVRLALGDGLLSMILISGVSICALKWLFSDVEIGWDWCIVPGLLFGICGLGWSSEMRSLRHEAEPHSAMAVMLRSVSGLGSLLAVVFYGVLFMLIQHSSFGDYALGEVGIGIGLSVLIAITVGVMGVFMMRMGGRDGGEFLVVLLGILSFVAGCAAAVGYSPLFVGMLCGCVIVNLPVRALEPFKRMIIEAEQPMAMVLMLIAGVITDPMIGVGGMLVVCVLIMVRLVVKLGVIRWRLGGLRDYGIETLLPIGPIRQSPLAIALAVGYAIMMSGNDEMIISGSQVLAVVILVGLVGDAVPLVYLLRLHRRGGMVSVKRGDK